MRSVSGMVISKEVKRQEGNRQKIFIKGSLIGLYIFYTQLCK